MAAPAAPAAITVDPEQIRAELLRRRAERQGFVAWLRSARTEEGPFPDWPYIWQYATDLAAGESIILLKERQILASWIGAAYAHWTAAYHQGHHAGVISAGLFEAEEFARKIGIVARHDGHDAKGVRRIGYANGSQVLIFPATETAGISFTLKLALLDEFSKHPYGRENLAAVSRSLRKDDGQLVIFSTSHPGIGATGAFHDEWAREDSSARKLFYGRGTRPDRQDDWYEGERGKPGMGDHAMAAYHPRSPDEAFSAAEGLLFAAEFDRERNVRPFVGPWDACRWRVAAIDVGGQDPTAISAIGINQNFIGPLTDINDALRPEFERMTMHVYGQYYKRGEAAASLQEIDRYLRLIGGPQELSLLPVDAGAGTASLVGSLQGMGYRAVAAVKGRRQAFGMMGQMLQSGRLTIEPTCTPLINEILTTFHKERRDMSVGSGEMPLVTPANHHADAIDTVKDAIMTVLFAMPDESGLGKVRRMSERAPSQAPRNPWHRPSAPSPTGYLHRMGAR